MKQNFWALCGLCTVTYAAAYFGRVNLSIAIPYLQDAEGGAYSRGLLGIVASGFFAAYAGGQFINGALGDKFHPRPFVALGLLVAGAANMLVPVLPVIPLMILFWTINGYFQSMLWGPILKVVTESTPRRQLQKALLLLAMTPVLGYLLAYAVVGRVAALAGWKAAFLIPGGFLVLMSLAWYTALGRFRRRDFSPAPAAGNTAAFPGADAAGAGPDGSSEALPADPGAADADSGEIGEAAGDNGYNRKKFPGTAGAYRPPRRRGSLLSFILRSRIWIIALLCVPEGAVKEGLNLWGPALIAESQAVSMDQALFIMSAMPLLNLAAIALSAFINRLFRYAERRTLLFFCALALVFAVALCLTLHRGVLLMGLTFGGLLAAKFAANNALTAFVPLNFQKEGRVSTAAGLIDCSIYVGAAIAGPIAGAVADRTGWAGVTLCWTALCVVSVAAALAATHKAR